MGQSHTHLQEQLAQAAQSELSGHLAEALIQLTQAMEAAPEAETLVPARARLLRQLRRQEEADQLIEALLQRTPESVPGLMGQAESFYLQEDRARALTSYRKVLSLVPDHLGARLAIERLADHLLPRRILLVLGMHRSGTSALAGFLCQHGFQGPAQSPPADLNNPTGYWEPQTIVDLHTALLEEAHSSWEDPLLSLDLSASPQLEGQLSRLQEAIQAGFSDRHSDSGIPLIKDPRQCRLQPLWNLLLKRHGITCALVLMNRHPSAVVQSLQRRDRLPADRALLLWVQHTLEAERQTRHLSRLLVSYEQFLNHPDALLRRVQALWPGYEFAASAEAQIAADMVRPELNHASQLEGSFPTETDPGLIELAMEVQAALSAPDGADLLALDRAHDDLQRRLRALSTQLGRMVSLQLFWRTEDAADFTEACSLRSTFAVSRASLEHTFTLPALDGAVVQMRLDPAEYPCLIRIEQLALRNQSGGRVWCWSAAEMTVPSDQVPPFAPANPETRLIAASGSTSHAVTVLSQGHDPALILTIPQAALSHMSGTTTLTIRASWEVLSHDLSDLLGTLPAA